jgi:hypothetical protein
MSDQDPRTAIETPKTEIIQAAYMAVTGEKYRVRVPVVSIFLERAEGPTDLCRSWDFDTFKQANTQLEINAMTAPKDGAYDKHDFAVTWADGKTYAGRYDLSGDEQSPSIGSHIHTFLEWIAYDKKAASFYSEEELTEAAEMANSHDFGQFKPAAAPDGWPVVRDYTINPLTDDESALANVVYDLDCKDSALLLAGLPEMPPEDEEVLNSQAMLLLNTLIAEAVDDLMAVDSYIIECAASISATTARSPLDTKIAEESTNDSATEHTLLDVQSDLDVMTHLSKQRKDLIDQIRNHNILKVRLITDLDPTQTGVTFQMKVMRPVAPLETPEG